MSKKPPIPRFQTAIIETHCHLDYLEGDSLAQTLQEAAEVGIDRIITIAVSPDNLQTVLGIAQANDAVYCSQGIHPHEADHFNAEVLAQIRANAAHTKVVAIGECGLDYYYDHGDRIKQREAFEQQLQLACDLDLPVVVHTREADEDTRAILQNFSAQLSRKGVIHSFTSGRELAEYCLQEGFCLGFNGICTFNKAENVREIVALTPPDKILLETDSPYLTPVPYRGKTNAPKYLPFVAAHVADIKQMPVEELLQIARSNSERVFFPT